MLNTKHDYETIKSNNETDWQDKWYTLLNSRFVVDNGSLVEDSNAKIFRLGFTVSEVETAINHTGYTQREIEWYESQPDRYNLVDGVYKEVDGVYKDQLLNEAKQEKLQELQERYTESKANLFEYNTIFYTKDKEAIQGTQNKCLSSADKTLPIDTFRGTPNEGTWLCYNADGSVAFVPFTKDEFIIFADAFYLVNSDNFTNYVGHETSIQQLTDIANIEGYDVNTGWV